jgi:hypothetical protein
MLDFTTSLVAAAGSEDLQQQVRPCHLFLVLLCL